VNQRKLALITWLLQLYPQSWRERYGQEMAVILEQRPIRLRTIVDLCFSALDARLDPYFTTERMVSMLQRLRSTEITIFRACVVFLAAGMLFLKLYEYDAPGSSLLEVGASAPILGAPPLAITIGLLAIVLSLLIGAGPILWITLRQAFAQRRWDVLGLLVAPLLTIIAFGLWAWVSAGFSVSAAGYEQFEPPERPQSPYETIVFLSLLTLFALGVVVTTVVTPLAARRVDLSERIIRFAWRPAIVVVMAMSLALIATVCWGLNLWLATPGLLIVNGGVFATPTLYSWLALVVLMALATLAAIRALWRGREPTAPTASAAVA